MLDGMPKSSFFGAKQSVLVKFFDSLSNKPAAPNKRIIDMMDGL
jgi:hypothetical protein